MITLSEEVDLFWSRKVTGATVVFLGIRYFALGYYIYTTVLFSMPTSDFSGEVCTLLNLWNCS